MMGPSDQVSQSGLVTSSRAWGKVPSVEVELPPPAEMEKELAHRLQVQKLAAEEAPQGRDVATFELVMEAAGPLMHGQLEGLGVCSGQVPPEAIGPSQPSTAVVVQSPMVAAS